MDASRRECLQCSAPMPSGTRALTCDACRRMEMELTTGHGFKAEIPLEAPLPAEVGGHKIEKMLGLGGMGTVYLAREPVLGRPVALKLLHSSLRTPQITEQLLQEAVITGTLTHPGIVPVYRVGTDPVHGLFYTMKLVSGRSLADILGGLRDDRPEDVERYTLPALLAIFLRTCEAVAFAHHMGIVHRDIKPANIMVGEFGEVMVLDWGLARVADDRGERRHPVTTAAAELGLKVGKGPGLSRAGTVLGTPGYMSPEQARGQAMAAGPPSDVYSLGAVLYQILTLRLPVDGRPDEQIRRTISGKVVPIEKRPLGRNAPRALAGAAMKALSLDPGKRHADARELGREIEAYLEGRVAWSPRGEGWVTVAGEWRISASELQALRAPARLAHKARLNGDLRFTAGVTGSSTRPSWRLDVWVGVKSLEGTDAYLCRIVAGEEGAVEFYRGGVLLGRRPGVAPDPHRPHIVAVSRDGDRISISVDGQRIFEHRDVFPLRGQVLAIATDDPGLNLSPVLVESRGTPLQLQFLALPDKLFSMGQLREARELYREMAETHAERGEGLIARYKSALCSIDLGEKDEGMAELRVLVGSSHEALQAPGVARIALRSKNFKEAWAVLTAGCEKYRNDPLRVEIWTNVLMAVDRVERESAANARTLYLGLLKLSWLAPHEISQVCSALMRLAVAAGGPAQARGEALALFEAHPTQISIRMELHSFLNRLGAPRESLAAVRQAIQKTLDLTDQVTRPDRARLLLWLIETCLAEGDVAAAEKWLTNAVSSLSHPSSAGLWARNWRALLAVSQGKWPEAEKFLALHSAAYATGESGMHFLSTLLESITAGAGTNVERIQAAMAKRVEGKADWKDLADALNGTGPLEIFMGWTAGQSREGRCPLLLAGSLMLAARGDLAGSETLLARAGRESDGRTFASWFAESRRSGAVKSGHTGVFPPTGPKTAKFS